MAYERVQTVTRSAPLDLLLTASFASLFISLSLSRESMSRSTSSNIKFHPSATLSSDSVATNEGLASTKVATSEQLRPRIRRPVKSVDAPSDVNIYYHSVTIVDSALFDVVVKVCRPQSCVFVGIHALDLVSLIPRCHSLSRVFLSCPHLLELNIFLLCYFSWDTF